ncbi:MAG: mannose-1-phosphate guanylyltransferase [Anaerolineae bacterium]|nr:mannose-1-phosphate guanylyltransferase [Anaerolineae bacterium]
MSNLYALIMAGGGGTRLWPLSRGKKPKQSLALTEERTLFQITVERLNDLIPPERIYVVTGRSMAADLRDSTPAVPAENFLLEPYGRDSGPAAGWGIYHIAQRDPQAVIAILSADHHIPLEAEFLESLSCAGDYAQQGYIITLGINPTEPSSAFGYIERGDVLGSCGPTLTVHKAVQFTEKPDAATAQTFLQTGHYSWNAGMFILQAKYGVEAFTHYQPSVHALLSSIVAHPETVDSEWSKIDKGPIDKQIMEPAAKDGKVAVIPVSIGWSDVGTWSTLYEVLTKNNDGNAIRSAQPDEHILLNTRDSLILSDKLVATVGVKDLVIIVTDDAVLVVDRKQAGDVKAVVDVLKKRNDTRV